jgi:hypothetical protein
MKPRLQMYFLIVVTAVCTVLVISLLPYGKFSWSTLAQYYNYPQPVEPPPPPPIPFPRGEEVEIVPGEITGELNETNELILKIPTNSLILVPAVLLNTFNNSELAPLAGGILNNLPANERIVTEFTLGRYRITVYVLRAEPNGYRLFQVNIFDRQRLINDRLELEFLRPGSRGRWLLKNRQNQSSN